MSTTKIAVYAICKNEAKFIERFLENTKDADYVVVVDTGSSDNTMELARAKNHSNLILAQVRISPFRFDEARNIALAMVPPDADLCLMMDIDELMNDGWVDIIREFYDPEITHYAYPYVYEFKIGADGQRLPLITQIRANLHKRDGFRWECPIHEYLVPVNLTSNWRYTDKIECIHTPDHAKERPYNYMLKYFLQRDPKNARLLFYCGREEFYSGHYEAAKKNFEKYLQQEWTRGIPEERGEVLRLYALCHKGDQRINLLWQSIATFPDKRDAWFDLLEFAIIRGDWTMALMAAAHMMQLKNRYQAGKAFILCGTPGIAWSWMADYYAAIAYHNADYTENAIQCINAAYHKLRVTEGLQPDKQFEDHMDIILNQENKMISIAPELKDEDFGPAVVKTPLISIVIPTYNSERYLRQCLDSVVDQCYLNLEVIIQDNLSTDATFEIIQEYSSNHPEIRWKFSSEEDNGQSDAINKAFKKCSGDILMWLNSDDALAEDCLVTVASFMDPNNAEWLVGSTAIIDSEDEIIGFVACPAGDLYVLLHWYDGGRPPQQPSVFWTRKIWEESGAYIDLNYNYAMDVDLFIRLAKIQAAKRTEIILGKFRQHKNSKTVTNIELSKKECNEITARYRKELDLP